MSLGLDGGGWVAHTGWFGRRFQCDDGRGEWSENAQNLRETRQNPAETCVKPVKTRLRDVTFPGFSGDFRGSIFDIVGKILTKTTDRCFCEVNCARPTAFGRDNQRDPASKGARQMTSSTASIQWRTGVAEVSDRCSQQPMLAV